MVFLVGFLSRTQLTEVPPEMASEQLTGALQNLSWSIYRPVSSAVNAVPNPEATNALNQSIRKPFTEVYTTLRKQSALPQTLCTATNTLHCATIYTPQIMLHLPQAVYTKHSTLPNTLHTLHCHKPCCTAANTQCHRQRQWQKQHDRDTGTGTLGQGHWTGAVSLTFAAACIGGAATLTFAFGTAGGGVSLTFAALV